MAGGLALGLYAEACIRGDLDDLWARTRDPRHHPRWDLRFTEIEPLPGTEGDRGASATRYASCLF
ncbi:hypothetical protein MBT84_14235 [Streptomyces sp. MBT84]|nr:hypothetical protein [Streptomyces sp. MBT84]